MTSTQATATVTATPYQLGERAYAAGEPCAPILDPAMVDRLHPEPGANVPALRQWIAGWTNANLAAPVD